jgi:hypothetical protein
MIPTNFPPVNNYRPFPYRCDETLELRMQIMCKNNNKNLQTPLPGAD